MKAGAGKARLIRFEAVRHTFSVLNRRADYTYAKDLRFTSGNLDKRPPVDGPPATMSIWREDLVPTGKMSNGMRYSP